MYIDFYHVFKFNSVYIHVYTYTAVSQVFPPEIDKNRAKLWSNSPF